MPSISGISNVLNRIHAIKSQFKPQGMQPAVMKAPTGANFNTALKQAMGNQGGNPMAAMGGPDSLMALLNNRGMSSVYNQTGPANQRIADVAKDWAGKDFKRGQTERCADFVSTMIENSGAKPPGFKHEVNCLRLQKYGKKIERKDLKAGDIVYFGNTYLPGPYTHVGIYLGDNKFVHRPTAAKPVKIDELSGYYGEKYCAARRLH